MSNGDNGQTHVSQRALKNLESDDIKRIMRAGSTNGYDSDYNPDGVLSVGVAENRLMCVERLKCTVSRVDDSN